MTRDDRQQDMQAFLDTLTPVERHRVCRELNVRYRFYVQELERFGFTTSGGYNFIKQHRRKAHRPAQPDERTCND